MSDLNWYCSPDIEDCATDDIILGSYDDLTPYVVYGIYIYVVFFAPLCGYWIRMAFRRVHTEKWVARNWIDISNLINWVVTLVLFLYPAIMFPLYWLNDPLADFLNAWYIVNVLADVTFIFYVVMFFMNLIIAIGSGRGNRYFCDAVNTSDCVFNDVYIDRVDAWTNWATWFILHAGFYFTIFWFGADAVRVVRPQGGYDLYYLWPNWLYELMVLTGAAPDHSN